MDQLEAGAEFMVQIETSDIEGESLVAKPDDMSKAIEDARQNQARVLEEIHKEESQIKEELHIERTRLEHPVFIPESSLDVIVNSMQSKFDQLDMQEQKKEVDESQNELQTTISMSLMQLDDILFKYSESLHIFSVHFTINKLDLMAHIKNIANYYLLQNPLFPKALKENLFEGQGKEGLMMRYRDDDYIVKGIGLNGRLSWPPGLHELTAALQDALAESSSPDDEYKELFSFGCPTLEVRCGANGTIRVFQ
jgi:hypothetical protein